MPCKISKIFNDLSYEFIKYSNNKFILLGQVWIQEINQEMDKQGIKYRWCYEKGNPTYYITQE
jgi:hypothetical protein